jgi:predicted nuclease with TOPRIM domain
MENFKKLTELIQYNQRVTSLSIELLRESAKAELDEATEKNEQLYDELKELQGRNKSARQKVDELTLELHHLKQKQAAVPTVPVFTPWVKVSDQLPPIDQTVFVTICDTDEQVSPWTYSRTTTDNCTGLTHWREIPPELLKLPDVESES